MDNNTFIPDYKGIKRRVITSLIVEAFITLFCIIIYLVVMVFGHVLNEMTRDIFSLFVGLLIAHIIFSVAIAVISFKRTIKIITTSEDGITINGITSDPDIDSGNLRGSSLGFSSGMIPLLFPTTGIDLIVVSSDPDGKPIRKIFWTGPAKDSEAVKLRSELTSLIISASALINTRRFTKVKERIKDSSVRVSMSKDKITRDQIRFSLLIMLALAVIIAGGIFCLDSLIIAVCFFIAAAVITFFWITLLLKQRLNMSKLLTSLEITSDELIANGDRYTLKDIRILIYGIRKKDGKSESAVRLRPAASFAETGLYLNLDDGDKECTYWLGPRADNEASSAIILANYADQISRENQEG